MFTKTIEYKMFIFILISEDIYLIKRELSFKKQLLYLQNMSLYFHKMQIIRIVRLIKIWLFI